MKYPDFIEKGSIIGITACSDGRTERLDIIRLENAKRQLENKGYLLTETPDTRKSEKGRSASGRQRAEELNTLILNDKVLAVIIAGGGDFLVEMLPYLDYEQFGKHPKWLQGNSDPTGLLYTVTTACDLATIYAGNIGDFGMEPWHPCIQQNLAFLEGKLSGKDTLFQESFDYFMDGFLTKETGTEPYLTEKKVCWRNQNKTDLIMIEGRLLGGCLDVLLNLVGTPFDKTKEFILRYKDDGILWYLESFDLSSESLTRGLWQLREAGWFNHAKGFVFGRPTFFSTSTETSYEEALHQALGPLGLPIIYDADFGHKPPRMTIVNGAFATITSQNGAGTLKQYLI